MADGDNREVVEVFKRVEKQLADIRSDLVDIKNGMPKIPYYGDMLQDIAKAIENMNK